MILINFYKRMHFLYSSELRLKHTYKLLYV